MMIRQDFRPGLQLPPRMFMEQIMDDLSKVYCFLWDHKNDDNFFKMTWKDLSLHYNKNSFRSNLRKLLNQGLLNYEETLDGIAIELVSWDELENQE